MKRNLFFKALLPILLLLTQATLFSANWTISNKTLFAGARDNNLEKVKQALNQGADLNITNYQGSTALFAAFFSNKFDIVAYLLHKYPQLWNQRTLANAQNNRLTGDDTILHWLTKRIVDKYQRFASNAQCIVDLAVKAPSFARLSRNYSRQTPIHTLAGAIPEKTRAERNKKFVPQGKMDLISKDRVKDPSGELKYNEFANYLMNQIANTQNVNAFDDAGRTALHFAAMNGYPELAQILISKGADANITDEQGKTPLHYAAIKGFSPIIKILLQSGVKESVNLKDNCGRTPLHWVQRMRAGSTAYATTPYHMTKQAALEAIKLLLEAGADLMIYDNGSPQRNAIDWVQFTENRAQIYNYPYGRYNQEINLLKQYAKKNYNANQPSDSQPQAKFVTNLTHKLNNLQLNQQQYQHHPQQLQSSSSSSSSSNWQNTHYPQHNPSLHELIKNNETHLVQQLITQNPELAKINNKHGQTLLHAAARYGRYELIPWLINNTHVDAKDDYGQTPLYKAVYWAKGSLGPKWYPNSVSIDINDARQTINQLIQNGANISLKSKRRIEKNGEYKMDETPLELAKKNNLANALALINQHRQSINNNASSSNCSSWQQYQDQQQFLSSSSYAPSLAPQKSISQQEAEQLQQAIAASQLQIPMGQLTSFNDIQQPTNPPYSTQQQTTTTTTPSYFSQFFFPSSPTTSSYTIDDLLDTINNENFQQDVQKARKILQQNRALASTPNQSGIKPLNYIASVGPGLFNKESQSDLLKIAQILINNGAVINGIDRTGKTPLTSAIERANDAMVALLLQNGADVTLQNNSGKLLINNAIEVAKKQLNDNILIDNIVGDINKVRNHIKHAIAQWQKSQQRR